MKEHARKNHWFLVISAHHYAGLWGLEALVDTCCVHHRGPDLTTNLTLSIPKCELSELRSANRSPVGHGHGTFIIMPILGEFRAEDVGGIHPIPFDNIQALGMIMNNRISFLGELKRCRILNGFLGPCRRHVPSTRRMQLRSTRKPENEPSRALFTQTVQNSIVFCKHSFHPLHSLHPQFSAPSFPSINGGTGMNGSLNP